MTGKKTILVVDDNKEFLELLEILLQNAGFQVQLAQEAPKAQEIMEASLPDAILLDVMMPVRNGIEFLENLRWNARFEHIPVIILTAMTLDDEQMEFVETFATAHLDKGRTTEVVDILNGILKEDSEPA